jgi:hypothetical protein
MTGRKVRQNEAGIPQLMERGSSCSDPGSLIISNGVARLGIAGLYYRFRVR